MNFSDQNIIMDTNMLLTVLCEKWSFNSVEFKKLNDHLHTLHDDNNFYLCDIVRYEYLRNTRKYLVKKKKQIKEITKRVEDVQKYYEKESAVLITDYVNLEENMLQLDKILSFVDIKYTDRLILLNAATYFSDNFRILTADTSDFIQKMPDNLIKEVHYYSLIKKDKKI